MQAAARRHMARELLLQLAQHRPTERKVREMSGECAEAGDDFPVDAKCGHVVADTLLCPWNDGSDRPAKFLKRRTIGSLETCQIGVDVLRLFHHRSQV